MSETMGSVELERQVLSAIDPARIERDLVRLVRTPSVTGGEEAVQAIVGDLLEAAAIPTRRLDVEPAVARADPDWPGEEMERSTLPLVIGRIGRPGGRRILLVGHVDVVPLGEPERWTVDPWSGERRDGLVYGRGAVDMKGGVAAIIEVARAIRGVADRVELAGELVLAFVPSEEDGGQGMLAAIREGVTGDAAIITEPSGLDVVVAHAGAITFRLTIPGRSAHASQRLEGVSALDKLCILTRALQADEARRNTEETHPLMIALGLPYPTIIGRIQGGDWASTVMDEVVAEGRYGVRLGQTWRDAEVELRDCITEACGADAFLRAHPAVVEITGGRFSSAEIDAADPLPVGVAGVVGEVLGREPRFIGAPYGADMRLLVNEGRTPTVIFGPGDIRLAHAADEFVPIDEVVDCARVLAVWALRQLLA